jgi:hypothetical protein
MVTMEMMETEMTATASLMTISRSTRTAMMMLLTESNQLHQYIPVGNFPAGSFFSYSFSDSHSCFVEVSINLLSLYVLTFDR